MRRFTRHWLFQAVLIASVISGVVLLGSRHAAAACTDGGFGVVSGLSVTIGSADAGNYAVWSRMQVPSANNTYLLEVDGTCYTVGGTNLATNQWVWTNKQSNNSVLTLNLSAGTHSIRVLGTAANVLLDRIIFTKDTGTDCNPPTGTGDDCVNVIDLPPTVSLTAPTSGSQVSGTVSVTATASDDSGLISKVEFYVNGILKATDSASPFTFSWVTTGGAYPDGTYSLTAKAFDASQSTLSSAVSVTVKNTVQKPGDADNDGVIGIKDLNILSGNYGKSGITWAQGDFDGNGTVDIKDLNILSGNWGK